MNARVSLVKVAGSLTLVGLDHASAHRQYELITLVVLDAEVGPYQIPCRYLKNKSIWGCIVHLRKNYCLGTSTVFSVLYGSDALSVMVILDLATTFRA